MTNIKQIIKDFSKQFKFKPIIENKGNLMPFKKVIVVGMGGSHLAADLLKYWNKKLDIVIHKNYGLPENVGNDDLIICSSYSGNTEETLDAFKIAITKKMNLAAISVGGELLNLSKENNIPYVQLSDFGFQPRMALVLSLMALLKIIGGDKELDDLAELADTFYFENCAKEGERLALKMANKIPVIYSSSENEALAIIWKININESVKIPAFYNVFPELNHNEMAGFDAIESTKPLSEKFHFIFLKDDNDKSFIKKRMELCQKLYENRGFKVEVLNLKGDSFWKKIFNSLLMVYFCSYRLSKFYNTEFEVVPMIEEFKKMMKEN